MKNEQSTLPLWKKLNTVSFKVVAVMVLLVSILSTGSASADDTDENDLETIFHIYNKQQYIGAVSSEYAVEALIEEKVKDLSVEFDSLQLQASEELSLIPEQVYEPAVEREEEILERLQSELAIKADSFELSVDGEAAVYLKDREDYDEAVRRLKLASVPLAELEEWEAYERSRPSLPELEEGEIRISDLNFAERISGVTKQVDPAEVMTVEEAVSHLLEVEEVNVLVKKEKVEQASVSYEKVEKPDESMYIGESEVAQKGAEGRKELKFELQDENGQRQGKVLRQENIIVEPIEQVTLIGTKEIPSEGSGKFVWPADGGYVSSEPGPRWGRMHNGIDIAQPESLDIFTSDHGIVKAAGFAGTFGNRVIVDHGNGYETIYAHLASVNVSAGDKVLQGSKIGIMGTTGRSTGIHLHFEILHDGKTKNPIKYLD